MTLLDDTGSVLSHNLGCVVPLNDTGTGLSSGSGYVSLLNDTGTWLSPELGCRTLLNDSASLSHFLGVKNGYKNIYLLEV